MSAAELDQYDHQFLDEWILTEEEILQELKMQSGTLNLFAASEKPVFGQPAMFPNSLNQDLSVFSDCQTNFGSNIDWFNTAYKNDHLVKPPVESCQVTSSLATNTEKSAVSNFEEKPKALQTSIQQSENIPIRRSTRSRTPKLYDDSIMLLQVKKSRFKRKISPDQVTSSGQENFDEPLKKFKMSENSDYESIVEVNNHTVKSKKLKAKKKPKSKRNTI